MKERFHKHYAKVTQEIGEERTAVLRKSLISEANQGKGLQKVWTLDQWKKVMWSDESRFTLFQSYRCFMLRREAGK